MPLQLGGSGTQGVPVTEDNCRFEGLFFCEVTIRIDFYSGNAVLAEMTVHCDELAFKVQGLHKKASRFQCNLWNAAIHVQKEHTHALFITEMDHTHQDHANDDLIVLFSCNAMRNHALSVLRRTGALLLDDSGGNLFGARPGTSRIDTHNPDGDHMRAWGSMPSMHTILEEDH